MYCNHALDGFFVVNKPKGWTSFDVVAKLRRVLGVQKIGHCGTLDPMATGVLVIGVGKATRLFEYMSGLEKEYEAVMEFGKVSDTDDAEGAVSETGFYEEISLADVKKALIDFYGEIEQIPPAFSAIHVKGQRSYDLVRKGKAVSVQSRIVMIFELRVIRYEFPHLRMRVVCSSGTYIRSLARDIGKKLGCGAILTELTRMRVGEFRLQADCHSRREGRLGRPLPIGDLCENLSELKMIDMSVAVKHLPRIDLDLDEFQAIQKGQKIQVKVALFAKSDEIFSGFYNGELVSILRYAGGDFLLPMKNL
ncbi:tRNA pseudouridine(55) synthase TruB [Candidatus Peregrinibacteria bacterium]|nr:tRNA pseudouridine(55) synthase TruB [Candidatus Peregrinibacteria bacterium]